MTLVGYWPLNEDSGDTAYDHSGNENHGTINSATLGSQGLLAQNAYSFDGNDDVSINPFNQFDSFSIAVWVNYSVKDGTYQYAVTLRENHYVHVGVKNDDTLYWYIGDSVDSNFSVSISDWATGNWYFQVLTFDGSIGRAYLNEQELGNQSVTSLDSRSEGDAFGSASTDNHFLNGRLCEIRIYDRALTQSEIQYLYNVGNRGLQTTSKKSS